MPSVFLRPSTLDYLKKQSDGLSIDATICRLLNLDKGASGLVVRHTPREKLADSFAYTWTILDQLRAVDQANPQLPRSELQTKVRNVLELQGLFDMFPDEEAQDKRKQPKWKARFTNALSYLKKMGCIEDFGKTQGPGAYKAERGVQYRATAQGLSVIEDIGLHICPRKELPATQKGESRDGHCYLYTVSSHTGGRDNDGNEIVPKPLVTGEIPKELAGRPSHHTPRSIEKE